MTRQTVEKKYENARITEYPGCNPGEGRVRWAPAKSMWTIAMYVGAVWGGISFFSVDAIAVFFVSSGITLCAGHSVGMHRKLIHGSFESGRGLEYSLVYLGTLVGLGGPLTMMHTHDLRDWAQRQHRCHDYFAHRQPILIDAFWQMHCDIVLEQAPRFHPESEVANSRFYQFLDRTAMAQQLPWAIVFFFVGGWAWVFWGICARVAVSVTGHWLIGYFAHNSGGQRWQVAGASVQGYDVNFCGLISFGECWHNNHHAFPNSAKIGIYERQMDPGWWLINFFRLLGLASNIRTPNELPPRPELIPISPQRVE